MTKARKAVGYFGYRAVLVIVAVMIATLLILESDGVRQSLLDGASLSIRVVIPSVFPFMVLSELISTTMGVSGGRISSGIARFLGIPTAALPCVICGNIFGFPTGARGAEAVYGDRDTEGKTRCTAIASNPSLAYIISGVGAGIYESVLVGALLYLIVLTATLICAIVWRYKSNEYLFQIQNTRQKFILSKSIFSAGVSCLGITASISFFCALAFLIREVFCEPISTIATLLLEVSGAVNFLTSADIGDELKLALTAFVLSFSGISAAVQCSAETNGKLSIGRFILIKLTEAIIAFILAILIFNSIRAVGQ